MKSEVSMIAPISPFRGGIAQHSTMLANAIGKFAGLSLYSYKRLYPRFLYPGVFQTDKNTALQCDVPPKFLLDTLNPLTWFRVARDIKSSSVSLVLIPWWTFFLAPCYFAITSMLKDKVTIVFICHNFSDHESTWWKRWISKRILRRGDLFLVHAESIRQELRLALPDKPCMVAPMPIYNDYPEACGSLERRANLELLFFGFIRQYKGLETLLRAVAALKRSDWHLSVVGECWSGAEDYSHLARELGIEDKVEFAFRYVSEDETAQYMSRADMLVLPYKSATGSAVIPLAYRYNTPVIVTPVGGLPDAVEDGVTGLVLPDVSEPALSCLLDDLELEECKRFAHEISHWKEANSWDNLASKLLAFASASRPFQHS